MGNLQCLLLADCGAFYFLPPSSHCWGHWWAILISHRRALLLQFLELGELPTWNPTVKEALMNSETLEPAWLWGSLHLAALWVRIQTAAPPPREWWSRRRSQVKLTILSRKEVSLGLHYQVETCCIQSKIWIPPHTSSVQNSLPSNQLLWVSP